MQVIGTLSGLDPDLYDTLAFSLATGLAITICSTSTGLRCVPTILSTTKPALVYSVTVRVTDSGGLTFDKQFTITIVDLPELAQVSRSRRCSSQRSLVKQMVLTFDGALTIATGAFAVDKLGTGGGSVTTAYTVVVNGASQTV